MVAYSAIYVKSSKTSFNLQHVIKHNVSTYAWPVGKEKNESNTTIIPLYGRYPCTNMIA